MVNRICRVLVIDHDLGKIFRYRCGSSRIRRVHHILRELNPGNCLSHQSVTNLVPQRRPAISSSFSTPANALNDRSATRERLFAIFFLIVIVFAVYLPVVNQKFSGWDEMKYINAVWKPGWQRAWRIVTDFHLRYTGEVYYNPLHMLSLMADQVLWTLPDRPSPSISKLMNVVYHAANVVLVFVFLLMTGVGRRPAFIGALIFGVHPVQVETVAWVAERKNLLTTLFYLAAIILFIKYLFAERTAYWATDVAPNRRVTGTEAGPGAIVEPASLPAGSPRATVNDADSTGTEAGPTEDKRLRYLFGVIFCFAASLLSKPSGVTLPVVLAALTDVFGYDQFKRRRVIGLLAALFVMALGWGFYVLHTENTWSFILPPWPYRPLISAGTFWFYAAKLLVPVKLAPIYPRWHVEDHVAWFSVLLAAFVGGSAAVVRYRKRIDKWILWGVLFFLINLVLVSGLIPFGYMKHSFVADHFLYLPMVGVALIIARTLETLFARFSPDSTTGTSLMIVLYLWVAALGVASVRQTWLWRDPISMWAAAWKANPMSFAANNNYGLYLMKQGKFDEALRLFKKTAELEPRLDAPYFNMGEVYRLAGDAAEAKENYSKAIELNPNNIEAYLWIAEVLRKEEKLDEAIEYLKKSISQKSRSGELHGELGLFYYQMGNEDDAVKEFTRAIELNRFLPEPYIQKGAILLSRGLPDPAIPLLETAVSLAGNAKAYNVLGAAYAEKGDYRRALACFRAAYKIQPYSDALNNVANALIDLKNYDEAEKFCIKNGKRGMPCSVDILKRIHGK